MCRGLHTSTCVFPWFLRVQEFRHICVCVCFVSVSDVFSVSYLLEPSLGPSITGHYDDGSVLQHAIHPRAWLFPPPVLMLGHARIWESMESGREPDRGNPPRAPRGEMSELIRSVSDIKLLTIVGFCRETTSPRACEVAFQSLPNASPSATGVGGVPIVSPLWHRVW